jgi:hypothetical protein
MLILCYIYIVDESVPGDAKKIRSKSLLLFHIAFDLCS